MLLWAYLLSLVVVVERNKNSPLFHKSSLWLVLIVARNRTRYNFVNDKDELETLLNKDVREKKKRVTHKGLKIHGQKLPP
jgi:hypothetical protein